MAMEWVLKAGLGGREKRLLLIVVQLRVASCTKTEKRINDEIKRQLM